VATKSQKKKRKPDPRSEAEKQLVRIAAEEHNSNEHVRAIHDAAGKAHDRLDSVAIGLLDRLPGSKGEDRRAIMRAYLACRRNQARYQVCRHIARQMLRGVV
jgi:hypothetical protein